MESSSDNKTDNQEKNELSPNNKDKEDASKDQEVFSTQTNEEQQIEKQQSAIVELQNQVESYKKEIIDIKRYATNFVQNLESQKKIQDKATESYKLNFEQKLINSVVVALDEIWLRKEFFESKEDQTNITVEIIQNLSNLWSKLLKEFEQYGLTFIDAQPGDLFDETKHEALHKSEDTSYKPGTIIKTIRNGYLYKTRVLRTVKVVVN